MAVILRPATSSDAAALAALRAPIVRDTTITFTTNLPTADSVAAEIAEAKAAGWAYLVAEDAGRVLGFSAYRPFRAGPGYDGVRETSVNLAGDARGRGLGRALMVRLEAQALRNGIHSLVAGISGDNTRAIAFHETLGFAQVAHLPGVGQKFGRRLDLILMQKTLVPPDPPSQRNNGACRSGHA